MPGKLSPAEIKKRSLQVHKIKIDFSQTDFSRPIKDTNIFRCSKHGTKISHLSVRDLLRVHTPCKLCLADSRRSKCIDANKIWFDYGKTDFLIDEAASNTVTCKMHGDVTVSLCDHLRYISGGCSKCDSEWNSERQRMTVAEFVLKSAEIWGEGIYDYSDVHPFSRQHELVWIRCIKHDLLFPKTPANHLHSSRPQGCPRCALEATAEKLSSNTAEFIKKAIGIHGAKYDYTEVEYSRSHRPVKIWCNAHEVIFEQTPNEHLSGHGCPTCGAETAALANKTLTTQIVVDRCVSVWGEEYDYSLVEYTNDDTPIRVICPKHGVFTTDFQNHTYLKRGCRKCGSRRRGKETAWLDSLGLADDELHREVTIRFNDGSWVFADGYEPETKTVYEFWGDFWHGNPKFYPPETKVGNSTAAELYQKTLQKRTNYKSHGYHLIEIWEYQWDSQVTEQPI